MAIETNYAGHRFRSRLEARWAAFFDLIDWAWEYEPLDGNGYIPDFLVQGPRPLLIEVKPATTEADYRAPIGKVESGLRGHWDGDVLLVGTSPLPTLASTWTGSDHPAAGLLGEPGPGPRWSWWESGLWTSCGKCGGHSVFHAQSSYAGRPCGCHDGTHHLNPARVDELTAAWARATNTVRWNGGKA